MSGHGIVADIALGFMIVGPGLFFVYMAVVLIWFDGD